MNKHNMYAMTMKKLEEMEEALTSRGYLSIYNEIRSARNFGFCEEYFLNVPTLKSCVGCPMNIHSETSSCHSIPEMKRLLKASKALRFAKNIKGRTRELVDSFVAFKKYYIRNFKPKDNDEYN